MGNFQGTVTVDVAEAVLYDYLSDVGNLPRYFARMTSATPGEGEEVHTEARLPDGQSVEGDAWFQADSTARRIEWGSEGTNSYHGSLEVADASGAAEVLLRLHTTRVSDDDGEVRRGIEDTLANIKRLAEQDLG